MVTNLYTNEEEPVAKAMIDISGLMCGSGSSLNNYRKQNKATNMKKHSTGEDICTYCALLDGPSCPELGIVENVSNALNEDEDSETDSEDELSTSAEWVTQIEGRGRVMHGRSIQAKRHGGPASRLRYYQAHHKRTEELGTA